ncbi:hypothetical protein ACH5RR_040378 [Cinchona calisaya]|uniref:Uncharacterized protein n=1 Tax=Cinchona calisaya TaxID=153742 RepID=A0ABD2XRR5_9GENT
MGMCLSLPDPDSTSSTTAENDDATATEKNPAERCQLGEHQLVLEEPPGIVCKCCNIVYKEMKDIFPDLKKQRPRRQDCVDHCGRDFSSFNELNLGVSACKNYYTSIVDEGTVLDLIPSVIGVSMFDHQLEGFLFLWKNIVGETCIENLKSRLSADGRGCIISHAPGSGKTSLTLVFIPSLMKMLAYIVLVIVKILAVYMFKGQSELWHFMS